MGPVAAETEDELADALKRIEELEGLIAEYILREAIMQIEIELLYGSGAQILTDFDTARLTPSLTGRNQQPGGPT